VQQLNFDIRVPFVDALGLELLEMGAGRARVRFTPRPEHLNSWQGLHGGMVMAVLDVALTTASRSLVPACIGCATVELKTNFLAAAIGTVVAEGRAQRAGRSLIFAEGEMRDGAGTVLAKASGTFKLIYPAGGGQ
jgi:uncharacterized protein (TIGR00369 family)